MIGFDELIQNSYCINKYFVNDLRIAMKIVMSDIIGY